MGQQARVVKRLTDPIPEWVSFVDRGANRTGHMVLKSDQVPVGQGPSIDEGMVARVVKSVMGAFGIGGRSEETLPTLKPSHVHTLVFDVTKYDRDEALQYAERCGLRVDKVEETDVSIRITQALKGEFTPDLVDTVGLEPGVSAVYVKKLDVVPMPRPELVAMPGGTDTDASHTRRAGGPDATVPPVTPTPAPPRTVQGIGGGDTPAPHIRADHPPMHPGGDKKAPQTHGEHPPMKPGGDTPASQVRRFDVDKADTIDGAFSQLRDIVRDVVGDASIVNKADALRADLFGFQRALVRCVRKQGASCNDKPAEEDEMTNEELAKKIDEKFDALSARVKKLEGDPPAAPVETKKDDAAGAAAASGTDTTAPVQASKADEKLDAVLKEVRQIALRVDRIENGGIRVAASKAEQLRSSRTPTLEEGLSPGGRQSGLYDNLFFGSGGGVASAPE